MSFALLAAILAIQQAERIPFGILKLDKGESAKVRVNGMAPDQPIHSMDLLYVGDYVKMVKGIGSFVLSSNPSPKPSDLSARVFIPLLQPPTTDPKTLQRLKEYASLGGRNREGAANEYIFEPYNRSTADARTFVFRWDTKLGIIAIRNVEDSKLYQPGVGESSVTIPDEDRKSLPRGREISFEFVGSQGAVAIQRVTFLTQEKEVELDRGLEAHSSTKGDPTILLKGLLYEEMGLLSEASECYRSIIRTDPDALMPRKRLYDILTSVFLADSIEGKHLASEIDRLSGVKS